MIRLTFVFSPSIHTTTRMNQIFVGDSTLLTLITHPQSKSQSRDDFIIISAQQAAKLRPLAAAAAALEGCYTRARRVNVERTTRRGKLQRDMMRYLLALHGKYLSFAL